MLSRTIVTGIVERIGSFGHSADVFYMTILLQKSNEIYRFAFEDNDTASKVASLTQTGDEVEFQTSEHGVVNSKTFTNKTIAARLQE